MRFGKIAGQLATPRFIPKPGGDILLSPDGNWFVNGYGSREGKNYYISFLISRRLRLDFDDGILPSMVLYGTDGFDNAVADALVQD